MAKEKEAINLEFIGKWSDYEQLLQRKNSVLHILVWEGGFWEDDKTVRPVVQFQGQWFGMSQQTAAPETEIQAMVNANRDFRRHEDTSEWQWSLYNHNVLKPLISEPKIIGKKAIGIIDSAIPKQLFDLFTKKKK